MAPLLFNLSVERENLWTPSKVSGARGTTYRNDLMTLLNYNKTSNPPKCMVSDIKAVIVRRGKNIVGNRVVCGHLLPSSSNLNNLKFLGVTEKDLNEPKNCVFWAQGIEKCYESLQISFVKSHPLEDRYFLKIWDEKARDVFLFDGSKEKVGDYEDCPLKLNGHTILKRALSYQAYQAYLNNKTIDAQTADSCLLGLDGEYAFKKSEKELLKQTFLKDKSEELEEEEDWEGEREDDDDDDEEEATKRKKRRKIIR